jgi:uncharacterized small protein (DUF1192 family)
MVDKILHKDKNYNLCVSRVAEKETRIEIMKSDIQALEKEFIKLKNEGKYIL